MKRSDSWQTQLPSTITPRAGIRCSRHLSWRLSPRHQITHSYTSHRQGDSLYEFIRAVTNAAFTSGRAPSSPQLVGHRRRRLCERVNVSITLWVPHNLRCRWHASRGRAREKVQRTLRASFKYVKATLTRWPRLNKAAASWKKRALLCKLSLASIIVNFVSCETFCHRWGVSG